MNRVLRVNVTDTRIPYSIDLYCSSTVSTATSGPRCTHEQVVLSEPDTNKGPTQGRFRAILIIYLDHHVLDVWAFG